MVGEQKPFYGRTGLLESRVLAPLPPPSSKWMSTHDRSGVSSLSHQKHEHDGGHKRNREETVVSSSPAAPLKWHPSSIFVVPQLLLHHLVHEGGALPSSFGVLLVLQHVSQRLLRQWWRLAFPSSSSSSSSSVWEKECRQESALTPYERHQAALLQFLLSWHYSCLYCHAHHGIPEVEPRACSSSSSSSSSFSSVQHVLSAAGAIWKVKESAALSRTRPSLESPTETKEGVADGTPTNGKEPTHHVVGGTIREAEWSKWFIPSLTLVSVKDHRTGKDTESGKSEVYPGCSWRSVTLIGRDPMWNDIIVHHPSCSSQHAALQVAFRATGWEEEEEEEEMEEEKRSKKEREESGGEEPRRSFTAFSGGTAHRLMGHLLREGTLVEAITKAREALVSCRAACLVGYDIQQCGEDDGVWSSGNVSSRPPAGAGVALKPQAHQTSDRKVEEEVVSFLLSIHSVISDAFSAAWNDIEQLGGGIQAAFSLELELVDLGSTNGTYLRSHGTASLQRLPPFVPHVVKEGDSMKFGFSSRAFVLIRPNA